MKKFLALLIISAALGACTENYPDNKNSGVSDLIEDTKENPPPPTPADSINNYSDSISIQLLDADGNPVN